MKILLIAALLIVCFLTIGSTQPQQKVWEYKVEYGVKESKINSLASQGWELAAAGSDNAGTHQVPYLIFRRAK